MSKAILVIDMPSCCKMCDLRYLSYWYGDDICSASEEVDIDYTNYKAKRNEKCPLKPIPEKRKVPKLYEDNYELKAEIKGYNECIDNILGDKYGD